MHACGWQHRYPGNVRAALWQHVHCLLSRSDTCTPPLLLYVIARQHVPSKHFIVRSHTARQRYRLFVLFISVFGLCYQTYTCCHEQVHANIAVIFQILVKKVALRDGDSARQVQIVRVKISTSLIN